MHVEDILVIATKFITRDLFFTHGGILYNRRELSFYKSCFGSFRDALSGVCTVVAFVKSTEYSGQSRSSFEESFTVISLHHMYCRVI